jgi:hypothetical protein
VISPILANVYLHYVNDLWVQRWRPTLSHFAIRRRMRLSAITHSEPGHAHAGVLLLMPLLYYVFLDITSLPLGGKHAACAVVFVGVLAQSGGFFVRMIIAQPNQPSGGTTVTSTGAALLVCAVTYARPHCDNRILVKQVPQVERFRLSLSAHLTLLDRPGPMPSSVNCRRCSVTASSNAVPSIQQ